MANAITVRLTGTTEVVRAMRKISDTGKLRYGRLLDETALRIQATARSNVRVDTGTLRRSIRIGGVGLTRTVTAGGRDGPYAVFVEFGTRAHFPPLDPLVNWVRRNRVKLGLGGQLDMAKIRSVAFAIARAIGRRGTPPRPFMFPAWEMESPRFRREAEAIARRFGS